MACIESDYIAANFADISIERARELDLTEKAANAAEALAEAVSELMHEGFTPPWLGGCDRDWEDIINFADATHTDLRGRCDA